MKKIEFEKAIAEGKMFLMRKYKGVSGASVWSAPKIVSAEVALKKSKVRVAGGYCPYCFEIV